MAEHARLLIDGIETANIAEEVRDGAFYEWGLLVEFFHQTSVVVVKQEGMDSHCFSYGSIYDLLYSSRQVFCQEPSLKGISQRTYQMIAPLLMQHPCVGGEISETKWNRKEYPKASYGMRENVQEVPYVTTVSGWQEARAKYYAIHQGEYVWQDEDDDDDFLPNRLFSDKLLEDEIKKYACEDEYKKEKALHGRSALATVFHKHVMGKKGPALMANTEEVGSRVCEFNYYQYEKELTAREHALTGGKRKIYSIINREKRKQYISLDFRHGMMEFHDGTGKHLGEFRFTGEKNAEAEDSHDLKTLKE